MDFFSLHAPSQRLLKWLTALADILYSNEEFSAPIDQTQFQSLNRRWQTSPWHIRMAVQCIALAFNGRQPSFSSPISKTQRPIQKHGSKHGRKQILFPFHSAVNLVKPAYFQQINVQNRLNYGRPIAGLPPQKSQFLPVPSPPPKSRHQVLVVGTGAGGAVLGATLAEAGLDVAFIEAGEWHTSEQFRRPPLESLRKSYLDGGLSIAYGRPNISYLKGLCR